MEVVAPIACKSEELHGRLVAVQFLGGAVATSNKCTHMSELRAAHASVCEFDVMDSAEETPKAEVVYPKTGGRLGYRAAFEGLPSVAFVATHRKRPYPPFSGWGQGDHPDTGQERPEPCAIH